MDFEKYYVKQAGSGIGGYQGQRYTLKTQRGSGFWGNIMQYLLPSLKYLGKQALGTTLAVADDVLNDKANIKESIKTRSRQTGKTILKDTFEKLNSKQGGEGIKRRKKQRKATKFSKLENDLKKALQHG